MVVQRMLKDGWRRRTNCAATEGREEGSRGAGGGGEQGRINLEDIRRHSPAALDEICQTTRRAPICSAACLYHDERAVGGSPGSFRCTIAGWSLDRYQRSCRVIKSHGINVVSLRSVDTFINHWMPIGSFVPRAKTRATVSRIGNQRRTDSRVFVLIAMTVPVRR